MKNMFRKIIALVMTVALATTTITFTAGNTLKAESEPESAPAASEPAKPAPPPPSAVEKQEVVVETPAPVQEAVEESSTEGTDRATSDEEGLTQSEEELLEDEDVDEEEEEKMPAQSFSKTASNGIHVSVSAPEGAFPEGTVMEVKAVNHAKAVSMVEGQAGEVEDANGVDITFHKDGKEIQPKKNISVKLSNAGVEGDSFSVYHVKDNGTVENMGGATGNGASFRNDEFSVYIIVGEEESEDEDVLSVKINYFNEKGVRIENSYTTEIEKEKDEKTGEYKEDGKYILNYTIVDKSEAGLTPELAEGEAEKGVELDGLNLTGTFESNEEDINIDIIYVASKVTYTVIHKFENENGEYVENEELAPSDTVEGVAGELTEATARDIKGFEAQHFEQQTINADGSTIIEILYDFVTVKLSYNSMGGSYIPWVEKNYGDDVDVYKGGGQGTVLTCDMEEHTHTSKPRSSGSNGEVSGCYKYSSGGCGGGGWKLACGKTEHTHSAKTCYTKVDKTYTPAPKRSGYKFAGWFLDPSGNTPAPEKIEEMCADTTVYAAWIPLETEYTIVYRTKNLDGSYGYLNSSVKTAYCGDKVTGDNGAGSFTDSKYYHYAGSTSATVAPGGKTVVYSDYELNEYKLKFTWTGQNNAKLTFDGGNTKYGSGEYIINCHYGENVAEKWPTASNFVGNTSSFYAWNGDFVSKRFEVTSDMIENTSNGGVTEYKATWKSGSKVYLHYMLQNANDNGYTDSPKYYQEAYTSQGFSAKSIFGFKTLTSTPKGQKSSSGSNYYFYYDRNTYSITYKYGTTQLAKKDGIRFEQNINTSDYNIIPSETPDGVDDDAVFKGWYDNAEGYNKPYEFNKMPGSNLVLYAVFENAPVNIQINYGFEKDGKSKEEFTVPKGTVPPVPDLEREGYFFAGWYDTQTGEAYDVSKPAYIATSITAKWTVQKSIGYTVKHVVDQKVVKTENRAGKPGQKVQAEPVKLSGYDGYVADSNSKTMVLTGIAADNVITFTYSKPSEFKYVVKYVYEGKTLAKSKDLTTDSNHIKVSAQNSLIPDGYEIKGKSSQWIDMTSGENVVVFELDVANYTITYNGVDGATWGESTNNPNPKNYTTKDLEKSGITLVAPSAEGKAFSGWDFTSPDGKCTTDDHNPAATVIQKGSYGDLVFTARWAVLKAGNKTVTYNGDVQKIDAATIDAEGYSLSYSFDNENWQKTVPGKTDAGKYTVYVKAEKAKYKTLTTTATLEIKPAELKVKTEGDSKVYDGTALTADGSISGFVNDSDKAKATFKATGSITEPGTAKNTYSIKWSDENTAKNYTVTEDLGTLEVTEYAGEVTVTTTGGNFTYDGKAHGATVDVTGLPKGYEVKTAKSKDKATHVSEGTVTADCDELKIVNAQGTDVTGSLNISYVTGTITVTPATLTVKTEGADKVYDGKALTAEGSITGFVSVDGTAEEATFSVTGSQTEVGDSDNTYSLVFDKTAQEADYTVNEEIGKLVVTETEEEIVVTTTGGEFTYDSKAHGATVSVSELPKGYKVAKAESSATATHVSDGKVTADCDQLVIENAAGTDVTSKLTIRKVPGSIEITPVTLTVTTPSASKTYDGKALTSAGSVSGLIGDETVSFETTGTQTAVGSSANTYNLTFNKTAQAADYTVSPTVGTLTVSEYTGEIEVTTTGGTFTYDGKAHGATVKVEGLPEGYTLVKAESSATATHVSESGAEATCDTLIINNAADENVTSKLNISYADGTIVINPDVLTVKTEGASKVYDGEALTCGDYEVSSANGLIAAKSVLGSIAGAFTGSETVGVTVTGTITDVGNTPNTAVLSWTGSAKESDYTVREEFKPLVVTEASSDVTVTTTGGEFTYDGKSHGATVAVTGLPAGYRVEKAVSNATATDVTNTPVVAVCDELVIVNKSGVDKTDKFADRITYVPGSITVKPAELTVTTPSETKTYDGKELKKAGSISGFVNNEEASFSTTGSQTAVGSSDNTYELKFDKTAKAANYTVKENIGTLTVNEYAGEIQVTTTGGEFTYDGKLHGATVAVSQLPEGYILVSAESSASKTHVTKKDDGTIKSETATCDTLVIENAAGENVTSKLNIKKIDGTITITPAALTVTTESGIKTYDGDALTAEGSISGFVNNEEATFAVTGSQTEVGTTDNTYSLTFDKTANEIDYTVAETIGKLTVNETEAAITVTTTGGSFEYDGKAHGATVSVEGLPTGYSVETATSDATMTHVSEGTVDPETGYGVLEVGAEGAGVTLKIVNKSGKDVTEKFSGRITYVPGTITIMPKAVSVVTQGASKTYDGTALTATGTCTGILEGETYGFAATGSQTAVGTSKNTYNLTFGNGLNSYTAKAADYKVSESRGDLTVSEFAGKVTVTTTGGSFEYDGTAHGATVAVTGLPQVGYTVEKAVSNDKLIHVNKNASDEITGIDADCDELVIKNAQGIDVTNKLNIERVNGTITVTPKTLTVTTESGSKVYDGDALTAEGSISGFVSGEEAAFEVTGSQTEVGTTDNTYSLNFNKLAQKNDYTVNETKGQLTVTESEDEVVVTTTGGEFTYDGEAHRATVSVSNLPKGYVVETASSEDTITHVKLNNAGEADSITANCDALVIKNSSGKVVYDLADENNQKLNVTFADDTFKINPAPLTVNTSDNEKVYDGEALTAEGSISGFIGNETAEFKVTGSQTAVGESRNTYKIDWSKGTAQKSDYAVNDTVGTLKVTEYAEEITATVKTNDSGYVYDGKAHGATVDVTGLPKGYRLVEAKASATQTDAGQKTAECDTLKIVNAQNEDVTAKLNITKIPATIVVTPAPLTVTTGTASKLYDGEALTAAGKVEGFVEGETYEFKTTGTVTEPGSADNTYSLVFAGEGNEFTAKEGNYSIAGETIGTLTVTNIEDEVTVTTTGGEFTYDGKAHGATVKVEGLPEGYTYEASSKASATDVTKEDVEAKCDSLVIRNAKNNDVTAKMTNINYINGSIKITPATLTVVTPDADKTYDGTALTAEGTCSAPANGETVVFETTGTQTAVGTSENSYTLKFKGEADGATADKNNYTVVPTVGTLEVKEYAGEIEISLTGGAFKYDGQEHGVTIGDIELPNGYSVEAAESTARVKDVADGTVSATCDNLKIVNADGVDVTEKLNIKITPVNISVTPREVNLTSEGGNKPYDGTALTKPGVTVTGDGFIEGEASDIKATGSVTDVDEGEVENTITFTKGENFKADNYTINKTEGKLSISKKNDHTITVTAASAEKTYDGTALTNDGYTFTDNVLKEGDELTAVVEGSITNAGTAKNVVTSYKVMRGTKDVTGNYTFNESVNGTLTVNKATLTVTTPNADKTYDGKALTAAGSITGFVNDADKAKATFKTTGTITKVGTKANTYSLEWSDEETAKNYKVSETVGTLTVNEYADTITATAKTGEDSYVYDGKAHGATVEVSKLPEGYTLVEAKASATQKDAGEKTAVCDTIKIINAEGEDVTDKLSIEKVPATIVVTPAPLTVTTNSDSKRYDGEPLTAGGSITGFIGKETYGFEVTGTITESGETPNTYSLAFAGEGNDFTAQKDDYFIESESIGILSIKDDAIFPVVVTTSSYSGIYDGKYHGVEVTVNGLPKGYSVQTAEASVKVKNVTDGPIEAVCDNLKIVSKSGRVATDKLNIVYVNGTIEITPRELILTSASADKVYDGKPLRADTVEVGGDGLAKGEYLVYEFGDGQTEVGSKKNEFGYAILKADEPGMILSALAEGDATDLSKNYDVTQIFGTLEVKAAPAGAVITRNGGDDNPGIIATNGYELTVLGSNGTPLANNLLDMGCCILHLLLIMAALIMLLIYTADMKRRQRRIHELEMELDE